MNVISNANVCIHNAEIEENNITEEISLVTTTPVATAMQYKLLHVFHRTTISFSTTITVTS